MEIEICRERMTRIRSLGDARDYVEHAIRQALLRQDKKGKT